MRILLDTHYLIWSFTNPERVPTKVVANLLSDENDVFYSQVSLWEMSIKLNSRKLILKGVTPEKLYDEIDQGHFSCLYLKKEPPKRPAILFYRSSLR